MPCEVTAYDHDTELKFGDFLSVQTGTASISFLCGMTTKIQAFYYGLIDSYTMTAVVIGEYVCALIYGCQVTSK